MTDDPKDNKNGSATTTGWVNSVAAARVVSAEELRRQAALFRPTPRQVAFRTSAEKEVAQGNYMLTRWFKASVVDLATNGERRPVSRREWDRWIMEPGFTDWFFETLPEIAPLTEQERQLADQVYLEGLMRGMQTEKDWAFKEYGRFRFGQQAGKPSQVSQAAGKSEVQTFLAHDDSVDAWSKDTKAEA